MKSLLTFIAIFAACVASRSLLPAAEPLSEQAAASRSPRLAFNRMVAHWSQYGDPEYLKFIDESRPQLAQIGFYGAHFWSLAHTSQGKGYPAHFPVQGIPECGAWFENINRELHQRHILAVGHMNVKYITGAPEGPDGPTGFFKFYRDLWDERELGTKPAADPLEFLERDAAGKPIMISHHDIGQMPEYWACLLNPKWQAVLKAWTKRGIERGVDGYIINYFYRHDCHCEHCVRDFKVYLGERFEPDQLREKFAIADLAKHRFPEIVAWHKPEESTPLRREMLRFSNIANKRAVDEVFVRYGRSLKPDLIVAQWNHLSNFSQISGDERCLLPAELWGKDEDYLWYSSGAFGVQQDLATGVLGELTLQCRYLRGAFDDKPYTLGKYEGTRVRAAIAELAANGGAPMGFYANFTDKSARQEFVRYYNFLERYDEIYRANRSHAEVLLLYPRSDVHQGDLKPRDAFLKVGRQMLDDHVLFDVLPDDIAKLDDLARYKHVVKPWLTTTFDAAADATLSRVTAPQTVRVSASVPVAGNEWTVHLVNYNRTVPQDPRLAPRGAAGDLPIAIGGIDIDLALPAERRVTSVEFILPEDPEPKRLKMQTANGRLTFTVPEFVVYGVARVKFAPLPVKKVPPKKS